MSDRQNFGYERDVPARSDAQPQIEIFACEKRLIEQAYIFETTAPNDNGWRWNFAAPIANSRRILRIRIA